MQGTTPWQEGREREKKYLIPSRSIFRDFDEVLIELFSFLIYCLWCKL